MIKALPQILMLLSAALFVLGHSTLKLVPDIPAFEVAFFRALVAVPLSVLWIKTLGLSLWGKKRHLLILRGVAGTIALYGFYWTLQIMPFVSAMGIHYLAPLFSVLFASFLMAEKAKGLQWVFMFLAFLGAVLVKGFDPQISLMAFIVGIGAASLSGWAYALVRMAAKWNHPLVIVFYFPFITLLISIIPIALFGVYPSQKELFWLIINGVGTFIAQVCMTYAYKLAPVHKLAVLNYLGIPMSLFLSLTLFHETFNPIVYLGLLAIFVGVVGNALAKTK